jgi:hypothetical protein
MSLYIFYYPTVASRAPNLLNRMEQAGKVMITVGLSIAFIGALMWLGVFRWLRLGRLPGDLTFERGGVTVYIPIVTVLLISGVLSLIFYLVGNLRR